MGNEPRIENGISSGNSVCIWFRFQTSMEERGGRGLIRGTKVYHDSKGFRIKELNVRSS